MITKSLPTFKHTSIGAKTHKARTATAHVSYIMRSDAMTEFQAENMPDGGRGTRVFFDKLWEKAGMKDNARIADKLMIALPVELNQEQRYELVRSFMHELGHGRIAWCAAHHDSGEDAHNPHAHIIFKDADIDTGRKVIGTTTSARDVREAKENDWKVPPRTTTADMRKMWCGHLNDFMERAGIDVRYDARTLKEQGIDRDPQIHIGPKAQALNEKGYEFGSHDRTRGDRSIPYTLFDHESRADHNRHIAEANKNREQASPSPHPAAREAQEKRELREAQGRGRKAMYQDQQRDRDALRKAHDAAKLDHQIWARKLYAGARDIAFQNVKDQYADKWAAVRAMSNLKQREEAAADLKLKEKKSYVQECKTQVDGRRPMKDEAWKAMLASQEKERLDLRAAHAKEISALTRQHIAERFAVHEKWRAHSLELQAARIDARLSGHQGMAAQQKAAVATIKLHARSAKGAPPGATIPTNPREAARRYFEIARQEDVKKEAIRQNLFNDRGANLKRAGLETQGLRDRPAQQRQTSRHAAANGKPSPRDILARGLRARGDRAAKVQDHLHGIDPQEQIQQAAASGQTLSGEQRANASPEVKGQAARQDRNSQDRSSYPGGNSAPKGQDKGNQGRSGGGRGR